MQQTILKHQIGDKLIHLSTGRPVELVKINARSFTVHTLDDRWPHPKTGKEWGGSAWVLCIDNLSEFERR